MSVATNVRAFLLVISMKLLLPATPSVSWGFWLCDALRTTHILLSISSLLHIPLEPHIMDLYTASQDGAHNDSSFPSRPIQGEAQLLSFLLESAIPTTRTILPSTISINGSSVIALRQNWVNGTSVLQNILRADNQEIVSSLSHKLSFSNWNSNCADVYTRAPRWPA